MLLDFLSCGHGLHVTGKGGDDKVLVLENGENDELTVELEGGERFIKWSWQEGTEE